jgi:hypothetical protein
MEITSRKKESILRARQSRLEKTKAFYAHNNHMKIRCGDWDIELSAEIDGLTLLHVTMWIRIEMERQLICIIDDWRTKVTTWIWIGIEWQTIKIILTNGAQIY